MKENTDLSIIIVSYNTRKMTDACLNTVIKSLEGSDIRYEIIGIEKRYRFSVRKPNAFIGGKLFNSDRTPQSSCGPFFSLPVVFAALFLRGDRIGLTRYSPNKPRRVDWISGACIMAPKKLFLDGLLFDEKIFMYMEEIDLLYRAKKKG